MKEITSSYFFLTPLYIILKFFKSKFKLSQTVCNYFPTLSPSRYSWQLDSIRIMRSTGKIKSDTFVILLYNTIIEVNIFITFDTILFYPGYHQIRVNTLEVLILTNSVSNKSEALNQSRGSDALHLEILPVTKNNTYSSNPRIIEKPDDSLYPFRKPKHDNCDDGDLNSSHNPSKKRNNHSSNNHSNLSNDFKYNRLLSAGENNKKVLECEFCGKTIALKSIDLTKKSKCLDEFLNEVKIYKVLAKLQGIYIPKLLFYSDLANGMSFVMGMTIVGTLLNHHRIDKWLKNKVIMTLKKVHEYNILHNDIHKENILIDEKGYVYLLD
ncbi:uncharacterized protein OCT59_028436 [Rhizophagus irregularis]|nr:hypothetical protein OCT59_028436 [Rhizophagus irregularis]